MPYLLCNTSKRVFWEGYISKLVSHWQLLIISDTPTFQEVFSANIAETEPIFIDVECSFDTQPLSDFHGFTLALDLRRKFKAKNPIIFLSIFSQAYFEKKSLAEPQYKILFGKGTAYLEYPCSRESFGEAMKKAVSLSAASLHDIITTLCDIKGIVLDKLNHRLKISNDVEAVFNELEPYLTEQHKLLTQWATYKLQLIELKQQHKQQEFYDAQQAFIAICNYHFTENSTPESTEKNNQYSILLLDDVQEELQEITTQLSSYFDIQAFERSEEAIGALKQDHSNKIVAILSDWRLYQDNTQTYWQRYQGYEVLQYASQNGLRALFALTSQADFVVHQLRNIVDYKFTLLKKQHLKTTEQWQLLADVLYQQCQEITATIADMPESANWTKVREPDCYKNLYIQKRQENDGEAFFKRVHGKADEVWLYVLQEKKSGFENIQIIKDKFGLEVPKNTNDLFPVMVLRLIWMGLWSVLLDNSDKLLNIYAIINTGNYKKGVTPNNINVELNKLCLTSKDLKLRKMLPEERHWLNLKRPTL